MVTVYHFLCNKEEVMYDKNNVFAKILRGEIPCREVYSDDNVLAFYDVAPRAKVHVLVIPRGEYTDIFDFTQNAPAEFQVAFWKGVRKTVEKLGLRDNFRTVANTGRGAGQSVMHFHIHIMSDERFTEDF
ncbi:MAG: HIT domain-containing protein [Alphaproteobacteria bacterium]|nr:HIT domain-containing protein [Alphaproteobacteria bacterium]MBR0212991.1 HIT domain-containing protein [Alphaproteobacteria bacterium]